MPPEPRIRSLYAWEVAEASKVYRDRLDYARVRIHENDPRPDTLDRYSRRLRRMPPLPQDQHNAMTIGNNCFFPVELPTSLAAPGPGLEESMGWLIHELGHAWQFQRMGWGYIFHAIWVQMTKKEAAYYLPDVATLKQMRANGAKLLDFSVEQQGDLFKFCYISLCEYGAESEVYQVFSSYVEDIYA